MADAKLIIKPPSMQVQMKPGFWPDLPKMQQTLKDAGYQPGDAGIGLRVSGKVVKQGGGLALELDGMKTPVTLLVVPAENDPETAGHLKEKHLSQVVEVEGRWVRAAEDKGPGSLAVSAITSTHDRTKEK